MKTKLIINRNLSFLTFLLLLFFVSGCNLFKDSIDPQNNNYNVEFGAFTQAGTSNIGTTGGTLTIKNGSSVDGLTVTVPSKGLTTTRQFIVSTAELVNKEIGKNLTPLSPVIKIENGGGYANGIIEVKIPAKIPSGNFPLAFFVDEISKKLEPIPVVRFDNSSVTIGTRHFSTSTLNASSSSRFGRPKAPTPYANLIISSMAESVINNSNIIASGFKPGTDDWEFINNGSYLATGGHCAGQNMAAMWYYFEKKQTDGKLFNKFNTLDKIQEENSVGYRFCSVIHNDLEWDGKVATMFDKYIDKNQSLDKYKWYAIAGAMLVTGEPQGVGIYIPDGLRQDGTQKYGGHDLICYQVDVKSGKLYISDPNTPGRGQSINLNGEKFDSYVASYKGGQQGTPFPYVTYYAKTAYIDWEKIDKRWSEVLNKKIGTVAPNNFPTYSFWVNDGSGYEIKDSLNTDLDTLRLVTVCQDAELAYSNLFKGKRAIGTKIYDEKGNLLITQDGTHKNFTLLKPGVNKLGVYVYGWKSSAKTGNVYDELYIDFKWIKVNYEKQAKFEYWLKGDEGNGHVSHFGAWDEDGEGQYAYGGTWTGNTFKVDKKIIVDGASYNIKITAVANSTKSVLNTFNVEMWIEKGSDKWILTSLDGKNLPLQSSNADYLTFGAKALETCQYFTRVDFTFWGGVKSWSCDETSFVRFKIPKP